jgi:hypothetical protein
MAPAPATIDPPPQRRREAYWRVEMGATGLRRAEVYMVARVVLIVGAVAAGLLLLLWPEAVSVVHRGD